MLLLGLTGGIASGKSTVSGFLTAQGGVAIIDADKIARDVVVKGRPAYREIVRIFGSSILTPEGEIDREKLGAIIFGNDSARKLLNGATHPHIRLEMLRQTLWSFLCLKSVAILDTPLLFESHLDRYVHCVIVAYCPVQTQKTRLMARNSLDSEAAERRIASQMSIEIKRERAGIVIDNSGSLDDTRHQVEALLIKHRPSTFFNIFWWIVLLKPALVSYIGVVSWQTIRSLFR
ncbi:dephospho-CoA kinase domain-containing protein-like protein [Polychytrium aggregatum]|uniref:dephospho-CoA kinase domain-containing protein-like protein n=1 Tax=Polychytrium aggregatum TaxID=110093 RepID=UPI0022FE8212|nr:dephospho-CoA kinase domain-containing protein-like protein [Polychytrium aggregatum]KAI9205200.1 dephospho-CoA kinase domain-containing protein-like protein [Polychytrium aggregatum]